MRNVQKHDVINEILREYKDKAPINRNGLETLYDRASNRGYLPMMIYSRKNVHGRLGVP